MTKIEDEMESSVHDCWSITTDIATILKYSDDITRDIQSLTDVYDVKFRKLMDEVDQLLDELHNVRDTYDELKPVFDKTEQESLDVDLFGNPIITDEWKPPAEWPYRQVKDNVVNFGEKKDD